MENMRFLVGQFLLALPGIGDPRFERSVIAMCVHDENGALGLGVGHLVEGLGFHDLLDQFDIPHGDAANAPVHVGGPVEPQRGFVLHSLDWAGQDTVEVAGQFGLSGSVDALRAISESRGPSSWLVALGYAGWGEGQLDEELTRHGWFSAPASDDLLFDTPARSRWGRTFEASGIDPRLLAVEGGRA